MFPQINQTMESILIQGKDRRHSEKSSLEWDLSSLVQRQGRPARPVAKTLDTWAHKDKLFARPTPAGIRVQSLRVTIGWCWQFKYDTMNSVMTTYHLVPYYKPALMRNHTLVRFEMFRMLSLYELWARCHSARHGRSDRNHSIPTAWMICQIKRSRRHSRLRS